MSDKGLTLYSRIRFWHVNLSFRSIHFEKFEGWTESLYTYRDRMSENLTNFQTGKSYIPATSIKKSQILIFDFVKNSLNRMKLIFKKFFILFSKTVYRLFDIHWVILFSSGATRENSIHHFWTSVIIIDNGTSNNDFVTGHPWFLWLVQCCKSGITRKIYIYEIVGSFYKP